MLDLKPKFIDTGSGEKLVILTGTEYEALLKLAREAEEDAADAQLFAERMAELRADPNMILPQEVSSRMMRGERLLTALRKWKRVTQTQLSAKTGLTQGYISDIESGRRTGSVQTLETIAAALEINPAWLTPSPVCGRGLE